MTKKSDIINIDLPILKKNPLKNNVSVEYSQKSGVAVVTWDGELRPDVALNVLLVGVSTIIKIVAKYREVSDKKQLKVVHNIIDALYNDTKVR